MTLALESHKTAAATEALDATVVTGATYYYHLTADLSDGTRAVFGRIGAAALLAMKVSDLTGIIPNPASSSARIDFALARQEKVRISVVDVRRAVDEPEARDAAVGTPAARSNPGWPGWISC